MQRLPLTRRLLAYDTQDNLRRLRAGAVSGRSLLDQIPDGGQRLPVVHAARAMNELIPQPELGTGRSFARSAGRSTGDWTMHPLAHLGLVCAKENSSGNLVTSSIILCEAAAMGDEGKPGTGSADGLFKELEDAIRLCSKRHRQNHLALLVLSILSVCGVVAATIVAGIPTVSPLAKSILTAASGLAALAGYSLRLGEEGALELFQTDRTGATSETAQVRFFCDPEFRRYGLWASRAGLRAIVAEHSATELTWRS